MKKRILSILLTLCMTLCLTPISVFAEEVGTEGSAAIQLGADALSVLSKCKHSDRTDCVFRAKP